MTTIQNLQSLMSSSNDHLSRLEESLNSGREGEALDLLAKTISKLKDVVVVKPDADETTRRREYQRWAKVLITVIGTADLNTVKRCYVRLARKNADLAPLLAAAEWDHLHPKVLLERFAGDAPDHGHILKQLLLTTLKTIHLVTGQDLEKFDPKAIVPVVAACLAQKVVVEQQAHRNRQWLLSNASILTRDDPTRLLNLPPQAIYMFSSYAVGAGKHEIKRVINRQIGKAVQQLALFSPSEKPARTTHKPTILVVSDIYQKSHAMMRCHGADIQALKKSFRCVLVTYARNIDDEARNWFDDVIPFGISEADTRNAIQQCQDQAPDMVYFPSIGIGLMSLILSNIRLAPIQFMALGHPASSFSEAIDYVVMNNDLRPDPARFSEKLIHRKISSGYLPHEGWETKKGKPQSDKSAAVQIGVLSYAPKLNRQFIECCQTIAAQASVPVRFHFFPNDSRSVLQALRTEIDRCLPGSVVHSHYLYPAYLEKIGGLDLVLSSFPFGNTNGAIDALLNFKPIVTLCGPEPHSRTDARLIRKLGLPDWLITTSQEDYIAAALRLINSKQERQDLEKLIEQKDPATCFFGAGDQNDFEEVVRYIFQCHALLQQSEKREFDFSDLERMATQQPLTLAGE